jgi:protein SCO1/2
MAQSPIRLSLLFALCATLVCQPARAVHDEHAEHHHHATTEQADPHAGHRHMADSPQPVKRSTVRYTLPEIALLRDDGKKTDLLGELADGRVVALNFMYTTCTEICPLTTKIFADFQQKLGAERDKVHLVSISIDPEQDRPNVLRNYAKKYGAQPGWDFYTGTVEDSLAAQKAFDAYRGDKMSHVPVTYLRTAPGQPWLRLDGFASADELLQSYRTLTARTATRSGETPNAPTAAGEKTGRAQPRVSRSSGGAENP